MKTFQAFMRSPWPYLIIVLLGISLKFHKLDYRYFWYDEVATIFHTSGIEGYKYMDKIPINELKNITYFHDLLHLSKRDLNIKSQLKGICTMTNLNPLHYGFLVFWYRVVGDDDIHYRYFNLLVFFLTLPLLFKLSQLIFKTKLSGWIALSIFSVAPFFQYYTSEARYNILCALLIVLNQYHFLKSVNKSHHKLWVNYTISGILCWYASFNLWLLFIAHFIYILIFEKKTIIPYITSSAIIFLGYLPWLISIFKNYGEIRTALAWHEIYGTNQNIFTLIFGQLYFAAYGFVNLNICSAQLYTLISHEFKGNNLHFTANMLVMVLLLYSVVYTYKKGAKKVFTFILLIIVPQFMFFLISDVVRGTGISLIWRYNILNIIGFMFFMVYLFNHKITAGSLSFFILFISFIALGTYSDFYIADKHLNKMWDKEIANAALLSKCDKPLLISDMKTVFMEGDPGGTFAFTNACKSERIDILRVKPDIQNITQYFDSSNYSDVFVLFGSNELINNLKLQFGKKMDSLDMNGMENEWQIHFVQGAQ